jgi:putative transposase
MQIGHLFCYRFTFVLLSTPALTMPRPHRVVLPAIPLHVIQRGNNRAPCFLLQNDYQTYLDTLRICAFDTGCAVHAYVLMSNHVHLLLSPDTAGSASTMMQRLGQRYVQYFNRRHDRTGTLWEGRFRSSAVHDERYFMVCQRYIELNPVRACMVDAPADYPWSSHRANAFGQQSPLITPHPVYASLGRTAAARHTAYRHLFNETLSDGLLDEVRQAGNGNRPLGLASNTLCSAAG